VKANAVDARRYAWARGHAAWIVGMPTQTYFEDLRGAREADQRGLLRYAARMVGDTCAVALNLALNFERPIPSRAMRISWALDRLEGHELRQPCWELIQGVDDASAEQVVERCERLIEAVEEVVGKAPNILTPDGYYPAIAMARDWLKLLEAVGEETPMPSEWGRPI
jgi:hypothetical protein